MNDKHKKNTDLETILSEALKSKLKGELEAEFKSKGKFNNQNSLRRNIVSMLLIGVLVLTLVTLTYFIFFQRISNYEMALNYLDKTELNYTENVTRNLEFDHTDTSSEDSLETIKNLSIENLKNLNNHEKLRLGLSFIRDKKSLILVDTIFESIEDESSGLRAEKLWLWGLCKVLLGDEDVAIKHFKELKKTSKYKEKEIELLLKNLNN